VSAFECFFLCVQFLERLMVRSADLRKSLKAQFGSQLANTSTADKARWLQPPTTLPPPGSNTSSTSDLLATPTAARAGAGGLLNATALMSPGSAAVHAASKAAAHAWNTATPEARFWSEQSRARLSSVLRWLEEG
jgi:hypothetical protein